MTDERTRGPRIVRSILVVIVMITAFTACTKGYGASDRPPNPGATCSGILSTVIERERSGDTTDYINEQIAWLTTHCPTEYDTFADYSSARISARQFGTEACSEWAQRIRQEAVELLSADALCTGGPSSGQSGEQAQPGGGLAWNQAIDHTGTTQRVCGPLAGSGQSEDDVFLNLGLDYPDPGRFQFVLWDVGGVEAIPLGTTLCAAGPITLYNGVAQMELHSAEQIEIVR
ncbi:hypothetical protein AB4Z18_04910 [Leifsonia sp. 2TAF2]|uniref:hypothetical protein n=1 Tax=Leifsonia sp. 2TAF2 TaxID=3233009 RepID=UPI003F97FE0B